MFVPLMLYYTYIIDLKVNTEITTSLVVRHVLNLQGPDRQFANIRCAFLSKRQD